MAMKSFAGWAVIPFRYSIYRKSDSLNSTPEVQHLITQGGMVRFGSTMACFLAERHLSENIKELRRLYNNFEENGEHSRTVLSLEGSPETIEEIFQPFK